MSESTCNPFSLDVNPTSIRYANNREGPLEGDTMVSLHEIVHNEDFVSIGTFFVAQVMFHRVLDQGKVKTVNRFKQETKANSIDRAFKMIVVRDLNARRGMNLGTILVGTFRNSRIYDQHLSRREGGMFGECMLNLIIRLVLVTHSWLFSSPWTSIYIGPTASYPILDR